MNSSDPFENEESAELATKVVKKMMAKRVIGDHKKQASTIYKWFPVNQRDQVKDTIEKISENKRIPVGVDPHGRLSLTSYDEAREFVESHKSNTEWL